MAVMLQNLKYWTSWKANFSYKQARTSSKADTECNTEIFQRLFHCRNTTPGCVVKSIPIVLIYSLALESEWVQTSDAFLDHNAAIASNRSLCVAPRIHVVKSSNEFLFSLAKCPGVTSVCVGQGMPASNVYWSDRVMAGEFRHDSTLHVGALPHHVRSTDKTYRKDECDVTSPLHVKATSTISRSRRNYALESTTDVTQTISDRSLLSRQSWK